jgi:hypothetical protein
LEGHETRTWFNGSEFRELDCCKRGVGGGCALNKPAEVGHFPFSSDFHRLKGISAFFSLDEKMQDDLPVRNSLLIEHTKSGDRSHVLAAAQREEFSQGKVVGLELSAQFRALNP